MIPEIGLFSLTLAFCLATVQAIFALAGAQTRTPRWMLAASPAAAGQFIFVALALGCLTHAFIADDFSVRYVAENANSNLPVMYKVAAVWGGHEGSMLLWVFVLAGWTLAMAGFSRSLPSVLRARTLGVLGLISVGFLLFILLTSSPFDRLLPAPADGQDLNPLLQDPAMAIHPPMLYVGYVGFAVVFSLAVAALMGGRMDSAWVRWSRPWATVAWLFLTIGILLGSFWAYYELGWGGWWFWDPVENASFMPWLAGTALIHSLAVAEKRGSFKAWVVLLAIMTFSLSLLGAFLVRSGVLTSVHSFASDPARGVFILGFLSVTVVGSLTLYAWRAPAIRNVGTFALLSRETLLMANNVLLMVACASVLIGTLYPLAMEALGLGRISVGPPYFNAVFVPLMLVLAGLIGLGPLTSWRRMTPTNLAHRIRWALLVSLTATGVLIAVYWNGTTLGMAVGMFMACWIITTVAVNIRSRLQLRGGLRGLAAISPSVYAMNLAHLGMAVFIIGAGAVETYGIERTVRLGPGDSATVAGYRFTFQDVRDVQGPNYTGTQGYFTVTQGGGPVADLLPEKRNYPVRRSSMTEPAIDAGLFRDLFVALGEPLDEGAWSVRLQYKPMIRWIWGGALMMALAGLLAVADRRYRVRIKQSPTMHPSEGT
ncbi:heme lyase CcmF/NrfE family subunit [Salinisphaera sp. P385]|uniref:Heme lyase CcmF/NrfE family subunit n=1 Tax=Spectribacter acetivorans TaxID=3075603 RepID=A0ABU3B8J8_9GAMM|nr:heme lyase CcmF/NrfE family subunit [Salinisphaera sp. P385]MDT0618802.1 heme lyase CcmF/NrfE family subunit [Salinisphaera sp. P385]